MGKLIALLSAGSGTVVVSVGGFYLVKNSSSGEVDGTEAAKDKTDAPKELIFKSVDDFESKWKDESKCVKDFFEEGFDADDKRTSASTDFPTGNDTFFNTTTTDSTPYKSCVIIDWKRENYEGDKWKGTFTWTWSFVRGNEGFVNFNIAETSSTEKKLEFKGLFYLLDKKSSTNKWKVKHKKEVKTPKKVEDNGQVDNYFPKKGTGVTTDKNDYWGFFKDSPNGSQLQNICGANECTSTTTPEFEGIELSWIGDSSDSTSSKSLKDWSKDLNWWSGIYDGSSSWPLNDKISSFKGAWTVKTTTSTQETQ